MSGMGGDLTAGLSFAWEEGYRDGVKHAEEMAYDQKASKPANPYREDYASMAGRGDALDQDTENLDDVEHEPWDCE